MLVFYNIYWLAPALQKVCLGWENYGKFTQHHTSVISLTHRSDMMIQKTADKQETDSGSYSIYLTDVEKSTRI